MFSDQAQKVNFVGAACGWEWAGILGDCERVGACQGCYALGLVKDHANVSVISSTVGGGDGSKHCSEFMC